ncbi:MAG TPA: sigma 54-interacting transcriptional regulator, partial [Vicinamibacterales bacterium]|nr:sigma 54-interacting transcriptional regulator [Vicinamibacterales bacterium]
MAPAPQFSIEDVVIGRSARMRAVFDFVRVVADSDSSVLVTGETGTGKEMIANLIHESSPRRQKPFVPVSCAILTETLIESELFGHERGAFTGA